MKGLTDIPGILVGHASDYDGLTGSTAILCEGSAVRAIDPVNTISDGDVTVALSVGNT